MCHAMQCTPMSAQHARMTDSMKKRTINGRYIQLCHSSRPRGESERFHASSERGLRGCSSSQGVGHSFKFLIFREPSGFKLLQQARWSGDPVAPRHHGHCNCLSDNEPQVDRKWSGMLVAVDGFLYITPFTALKAKTAGGTKRETLTNAQQYWLVNIKAMIYSHPTL